MTLPFEDPIKLYTEVTSNGMRRQVYLGEAYQNAQGYWARTDAGLIRAGSIEEAIRMVSHYMDLEARGLKRIDPPPALVEKDDELPRGVLFLHLQRVDHEQESMEPISRSPKLNKMLSSLMGKDIEQTIRDNKCMTCDCFVYPDKFRDKTSKHEYTVSGMCQHCQDSVFGQ